MNDKNEIILTPDFDHIFTQMLREARTQAEDVFRATRSGMSETGEAEALRAVQRWFAPLAIAAHSMTSREAVERFREAMGEILAGLEAQAVRAEKELEPR
jgi:hypothetical protein